jgi:hypothetical protein
MSEIEILTEFKTQLLSFFDELISQFPRQGDLVIIRIFLANQIPIVEAMEIFIQRLNTNNQELKKMIKERNELFFLEHNLFDNLGKDKVMNFKQLWISDNLDKQDKEVIWKWVDTFVYLSDKYAKIKADMVKS